MSLVIALFSLLLIAASPSPHHHHQAHKPQAAEEKGHASSTPISTPSYQPSPEPTRTQTGQNTYNYYYPTSKSESPPIWFQELTTFILILFTGGLWLTSIWQWQALKEQSTTATKAANAAIATATAHVYIMRVGIQGLVDVLDANPVADPLFQYGFTNYGKTPAFLTELCIEYCIQPALPERPIYRKPIMLAGMVVIPAEKDSPALDERWRVMFDKYFLQQEFEPIRQGNSLLFLYGYFRYRDVFETRYRIGFAFGFTASMAPLVYTSRDAPAYVYREKENS